MKTFYSAAKIKLCYVLLSCSSSGLLLRRRHRYNLHKNLSQFWKATWTTGKSESQIGGNNKYNSKYTKESRLVFNCSIHIFSIGCHPKSRLGLHHSWQSYFINNMSIFDDEVGNKPPQMASIMARFLYSSTPLSLSRLALLDNQGNERRRSENVFISTPSLFSPSTIPCLHLHALPEGIHSSNPPF